MRRVLTLVSMIAAMLAPYFAFVLLNGGIVPYLQGGIEFSAREAGRQPHVWPPFADVVRIPEATLLYIFHAMPWLALITLLVRRSAPDFRTTFARVVPVAVVAAIVNFSFIRDPLDTRLPDAIVPAVVLAAWIALVAWTARRSRWTLAGPRAASTDASAARDAGPYWIMRAASAALLAFMAYSTIAAGNTIEELDRAGLLVSWARVPGYARELAQSLQTPLTATQLPSSSAGHLLPFLEYVGRCTPPDQRLLVTGFLPEVPVLANRPFAGGQSTFIPGYFSSDENQRRVLARLRGQIVPFALVPKDYAAGLDVAFPLLTAYLRARYEPLATFGEESESGVQVLVDSTLRWPSRDAKTGWPCQVQG